MTKKSPIFFNGKVALEKFLHDLKPHIEKKHCILYGGANDPIPGTFEVVCRCNHHWGLGREADLVFSIMQRLGRKIFKDHCPLTGNIVLHCILKCNPKSLYVAGFDFYYSVNNAPVEKARGHDVYKNYLEFKQMIKNPKVTTSPLVKNALEIYREFFKNRPGDVQPVGKVWLERRRSITP